MGVAQIMCLTYLGSSELLESEKESRRLEAVRALTGLRLVEE